MGKQCGPSTIMGVQVSRVCDGGKGQSLQPFPAHARVVQLRLRYDGVIGNVSLWYTVSEVGILMVALCQIIGYPVLTSILHRADQTTGDARPTSRWEGFWSSSRRGTTHVFHRTTKLGNFGQTGVLQQSKCRMGLVCWPKQRNSRAGRSAKNPLLTLGLVILRGSEP